MLWSGSRDCAAQRERNAAATHRECASTHGCAPSSTSQRLVQRVESHSGANLLADEKHIYRAQVKVVEEGESS